MAGTALATPPASTGSGAAPTPVPAAPSQDWRSGLPDDLKSHAALEKFNGKGVDAVVRQLIETEKSLGGRVAIPGADAKPEEWDAFYGRIGRPAKVEEYKIPEALSANPDDKAVVTEFIAQAHAAGLSQKQVDATLNWYTQRETARLEAAAKADLAEHQEAEAALRKEWGAAYESNLGLAQKAVLSFGGEALAKWMNETGLGDDPVLIRAFAAAGKLVSEDTIRGRGMTTQTTPEQAKEALNAKEIDQDFQKALHDRRHPQHDATMVEYKRLLEAAYPGNLTV